MAGRDQLDAKLYISVLSPLLALVLAAAFGVLWACRRENDYVAQIAIGFFTIGAAFLVQAFGLGLDRPLALFLSNLLFACAIVLMVSAVLRRRSLPVPMLRIGIAFLATVCLTGWFIWPQEDFASRVVVVNYGLCIICAIGATTLYRAGSPTVMDKLIMTVLLLGIGNFFVRPITEFLLGDLGSQSHDMLSPYWLHTSLAATLYCVLVALTMFSAAALDAIRELQAQTETDPLSGLLNRRGFETRGAELLQNYAAPTMPVALIVADLDHFKTINDQYGHAMGDRVIAEFARGLVGAMGTGAIAGRLGGEEFAVLLPLTNLNGARLFAEAIRSARLPIDGLSVTASFGVAQRLEGEDLEQLIHRGDEALYEAKHNGRNCVRLARAAQPAAMPYKRPALFRPLQ